MTDKQREDYIEEKAKELGRQIHREGFILSEVLRKDFICTVLNEAPVRKPKVSKKFVGKVTARIYCDRKSVKAIKTNIQEALEEAGVEVEKSKPPMRDPVKKTR